jgi:ATP-dependent helicase/nuclease subunit A
VAKAVGIVCHLLLERWDGRDDDALLEGVARLSRAVAREAGADPTAVEEQTRDILRGLLASELRDRLREVEVLGREVPLVEHDGDGPAYRGTLDLLYRDSAGDHVVADYKTDRETDPAKLAETYGPQLSVYARAVRKALGLTNLPRTELWLLRSGRIHPLS